MIPFFEAVYIAHGTYATITNPWKATGSSMALSCRDVEGDASKDAATATNIHERGGSNAFGPRGVRMPPRLVARYPTFSFWALLDLLVESLADLFI